MQEFQAVNSSADEAKAIFRKTIKLGFLLGLVVLVVVTAIARLALG
jgi:hypothetical protein